MKARVLILALTYPPNKDGVASAAALLAEGLAGRGHEVRVGTVWHPERKVGAPDANPKVFQFKVAGGPSRKDPMRGEIAELRQFVSSFRADVLFCHCLDTVPSCAAIDQFSQIPAAKVLISHGYQRHLVPWRRRFPWGLGFWLRWQPFVWRLPWLLRKFDRLVFLSEQRDFQRFFDHRVARFIRHPGIRVIPNGVDWPQEPVGRPDFRHAHGLEGKLLFLCVANYLEHKNQLLALRAYRQARLANSALVFIGSEFNAYSRQLQQADECWARAFPEGRVLLLEKVGRDWTEAALDTMDCFVSSARAETQPIVLLESMAAGKPFLSTRSGCVQSLAGGIAVHSEREMLHQFQRLAHNPALRARLGTEGRREYLAKYRKEAVLDAYERLVLELTHSRSSSERGAGLATT